MADVVIICTFSRRTKIRLVGGTAIGLAALALNPAASAQQCVPDAAGICTITNSTSGAQIVTSGPTAIVNNGASASIAQGGPDYLLITNNSGASISSLTLAPRVGSQPIPGAQLNGVTIVNSGAIAGDVVFGNGGTYVNNGGTVSGNVTARNPDLLPNNPQFGLNFNSETFINRSIGGTGVSGTIDPGIGIDTFVQSFASSGSYALPSMLPTHFEIAGVEALGAGTTVTVTNGVPGTANNGLSVWGNGIVVNQATINDLSFAGSGLPPETIVRTRAVFYGGEVGNAGGLITIPTPSGVFQSIGFGGALSAFTNDGVINGDILLRTAAFVNTGAINLKSDRPGTIILSAADRDFTFTNSGTVTLANSGVRAFGLTAAAIALGTAPNTTTLNKVTIGNSGQIAGGLSFDGLASDFAFINSGTISLGDNPNPLDRAVDLSLGYYDLALTPALQADVAANSVIITNAATGVIDGGIDFSGAPRAFSFTNNGTINHDPNDLEADAVDIEVTVADTAGTNDQLDAQSESFVNTGVINGSVSLEDETETSALTFDNSGTITRTVAPADLFARGLYGVEINQETTLGATLNFTNSGTISTADYAGVGVGIDVEAGDIDSGNPLAQSANADVVVVNSGTIRASGGSYVTPGVFVGLGQNVLSDLAAGLVVSADAEGVSRISITNAAGAVITARGEAHLGLPNGAQPIANQDPKAGGIGLAARADIVTIVNDGTILGTPGGSLTLANGVQVIPNVDSDVDFQNIIGGGIDTFASTDTVINTETGIIGGSVALRDGDDSLTNYGFIDGSIFFGTGNDRFVQGVRATLTGIADGGAGDDSAFIDITGGGTVTDALYAKLVNFETIGLTGTGTVTSNQEVVVDDNLALEEGSVINRPGETAISGSATEGNDIANSGTVIGNVALGGGDNSLTNDGTITGDVTAGAGADQLTNAGTITGDVDLGDGADSFANTGTITGDVNLAGGADSVDGQAIGAVSGTIFGGNDGNIDSVDFNLAPAAQASVARSFAALANLADTSTVLDLSLFEHLDGFEVVTVDGPGTVEASGALPVNTIILNGADLHVASGSTLGTTGATTVSGSGASENLAIDGTVNGGIALGDGADSLTTGGTITGPVDLGAGADRLILTSAASFESGVSGGAGTDSVVLATGGTVATPTELTLTGFSDFEGLENSSGTAALSGTTNIGPITVSGGRLIGRTGSSIIGAVQVASGATFGSAGSVTGNIAVATGGILSPGASPGTMTVNGNIALASGTTTLFELTPTVTDQIIINGSLTIAGGATLNLTGERPLTPGSALDLIIATGGITGSYATITLAPNVYGFVSQTSTKIRLLGQFGVAAGTQTQTAATIDYVNAVLVGQQGSAALLAAIPTLLTSTGTTNTAAFAQLNPEAYASASQMGIEHGLTIAKAGRHGAIASVREEAGLYSFAQGLGNTRKLSGNGGTGVSRSNMHSYGVLGGLGFGSKTASVGAFIGYLDGRQKIGGLGARTDADGIIAGISGRLETEGFDLTALFAYDGSTAKTSRTLPGGATAHSQYKLRNWVWDISAGYSIPAGTSWALRPEAGLTYISNRRSAVAETGSAAFGLAVTSKKTEATFIDGALTARGGQQEGATFHPWLSGGIRHQITGGGSTATGGFIGTSTRFTVLGAARKQTLATAAAGLSADLSPGISLFAAYQGEFGKGGEGHNGNVGIRIGF